MGEFFQTRAHIEYLVQHALPELIRSYGYGIWKKLIVWSVQCDDGGDAYTLAMVLSEFAEKFPGLGFDFMILATDLSKQVLDVARRGIYSEESISAVPIELRKKYLLRSKDRNKGLIRVATELRETVKFRQVDFAEGSLKFREPIDVIFAGHSLSFLDSDAQASLVRQFHRHLSPGGYVFLECGEPIGKLRAPLIPVTPTIYRKQEY